MKEQSPTPTRGVPLMLDRERRLRFSLRTIKALKQEFGENALSEGIAQDSIARLLWFGLREDDPELTIEMLEDLVDLENLSDVMDAVSLATGNRSSLEVLASAEAAVAAAKKDDDEEEEKKKKIPLEPGLVQETEPDAGQKEEQAVEVVEEKVAPS